ncbi:uncharacterized protein LOC127810883 isoform X1 [Diospyros lotus]|uniref:uncharacterized protein LOC127810883 isoform X1 n=1 Tax=Diospyros lotus TaxID=55363 RepID=UPI0022553A64|nr:uncharacterized protein LOC127810883 isoform X1 [Diospyros lotus]
MMFDWSATEVQWREMFGEERSSSSSRRESRKCEFSKKENVNFISKIGSNSKSFAKDTKKLTGSFSAIELKKRTSVEQKLTRKLETVSRKAGNIDVPSTSKKWCRIHSSGRSKGCEQNSKGKCELGRKKDKGFISKIGSNSKSIAKNTNKKLIHSIESSAAIEFEEYMSVELKVTGKLKMVSRKAGNIDVLGTSKRW